jgi:hypothetical protein
MNLISLIFLHFLAPIFLAVLLGQYLVKRYKSKIPEILFIGFILLFAVWYIIMLFLSDINNRIYKATVISQFAYSIPFFLFSFILILVTATSQINSKFVKMTSLILGTILSFLLAIFVSGRLVIY